MSTNETKRELLRETLRDVEAHFSCPGCGMHFTEQVDRTVSGVTFTRCGATASEHEWLLARIIGRLSTPDTAGRVYF